MRFILMNQIPHEKRKFKEVWRVERLITIQALTAHIAFRLRLGAHRREAGFHVLKRWERGGMANHETFLVIQNVFR